MNANKDLSGDLHTLLAIAREGSLAGAARRLRVNHSTVFRRLGAIEARLATRLFERQGGSYVTTAAGEDLLRTAERVEAEMEALERRLSGRDLRLTGSLRLTAPDDIAEVLLMPLLVLFRQSYPEITVELVIDNRMLSLTKREADIALRPTREPPESLSGRRIATLASTVYCGGDSEIPAPGELAGRRWVAWDEGAGPPGMTAWLTRTVDRHAVGYRSNSLLNQASAVRADLGLAVLPCFLGDADPGLRRVMDPPEDLDTGLWLLTHPDLRRSARIRALVDLLYSHLRTLEPRLNGASNR
ncbi:LysR family transcriptional regulator [Pelagibius litoralis]|uniref:LysR family transcriptional regulator n=1 Tax=Pelagibius litoralis TaxID=374515 RepID=A0A967C2B7_9PROT|nr:LysR family transcriptional regulator [Pelagibius litoralis]NIA68213.1 LysR family transcriptional regulator [Pelagibius litoralis]